MCALVRAYEVCELVAAGVGGRTYVVCVCVRVCVISWPISRLLLPAVLSPRFGFYINYLTALLLFNEFASNMSHTSYV